MKSPGMKTLGILLLCAAAVPLVLPGPFYLSIATQVLVYGLFAVSVNLIAGYCGMVSLGHAAFLGIAGYAFALLTTSTGWPLWAAIPAAVALSVAAGALFGLVALGYMWVRMAEVAYEKRVSNPDDAAFYDAKIVTARFFMEKLLPDVAALWGSIKAGKGAMMALDEAMF